MLHSWGLHLPPALDLCAPQPEARTHRTSAALAGVSAGALPLPLNLPGSVTVLMRSFAARTETDPQEAPAVTADATGSAEALQGHGGQTAGPSIGAGKTSAAGRAGGRPGRAGARAAFPRGLSRWQCVSHINGEGGAEGETWKLNRPALAPGLGSDLKSGCCQGPS